LPSPSTPPSHGRLLKVLGVGFGLAVTIGNTIGGGIFRTPGVIAEQLPNVWLFLGVWLLGGVYALLGAVSLAELGTMLPRSGGQYVFVRHALGDYAGFVAGWSDWISTCGSAAAVSIVIAEFTGTLFPPLAGITTPLAATVAIVFAVLQSRGITWGSSVQNVTSMMKAVAFLILIAAAFVLGGGFQNAFSGATQTHVLTGSALLVALVLSLQSVIYTYDGWTGVIYFSEEVKNPARDIPRSMFGGLLLVIVIYLLVNVALLYVLPLSDMAGKPFAAGVAAEVIFGRHGNAIFLWLTIISMLSAVNAFHLMATRVLFAMSRDGLFATRAAEVNAGGTPGLALFISATVAVLFIVFGRTFERVITVLAFFFVGNYALSFISVFVLRRREPNRERPYRVWGYPWTTALGLLGLLLFLAGAVWGDRENSLYALLLLAISYPVFRLVTTRRGQD
jgi:basic amino acid/polyamine antiporter, APA family